MSLIQSIFEIVINTNKINIKKLTRLAARCDSCFDVSPLVKFDKMNLNTFKYTAIIIAVGTSLLIVTTLRR